MTKITNQENYIANNFEDLRLKTQFLIDFCRENKIFLIDGKLESTPNNLAHVVFRPNSQISNLPNTEQGTWDLLVSRFKHFKPASIIIEPIITPVRIEEVLFFHLLADIDEDMRGFTNQQFNDWYQQVRYKCISFRLYAFYPEQAVYLDYIYRDGFLKIFDLASQEIIDRYDDEHESDDEFKFDAAYIEESNKKLAEALADIEKYGKELSTERKIALTRNSEQRYAVAKEFFGERFSSIKTSIDAIVKRALDIFELEVLPNLVKNLKNEQKTVKQISDELGISLAKAKKIYAIV